MGHAVEISKFYLSGECYIFLHAYLSYSLTRVTKNRWRKKTDIPYGMSYAYNIRPRLHTGSIFFVICIALRLKFRKWRHFWSSSSLNKYRVRGCDVKKKFKIFRNSRALGPKGPAARLFRNILNFFLTSHPRTRYLFKDSNDQKWRHFRNSHLVRHKLQKKFPPYVASGVYYIQ